MIIQGSDKPIVIEGEVNEANVICAELFCGERKVKTWYRNDILWGTNQELALPLTQEETLAMPSGKATLEVKWRGKFFVECAEVIEFRVVKRKSKEVI